MPRLVPEQAFCAFMGASDRCDSSCMPHSCLHAHSSGWQCNVWGIAFGPSHVKLSQAPLPHPVPPTWAVTLPAAYRTQICVHTTRNRYCTEGMFRASNRAEVDPAGSPREAAHLPGAPFHSFTRADAQPLPHGQAVRVRFQLLPTAYRFAKVIAGPLNAQTLQPTALPRWLLTSQHPCAACGNQRRIATMVVQRTQKHHPACTRRPQRKHPVPATAAGVLNMRWALHARMASTAGRLLPGVLQGAWVKGAADGFLWCAGAPHPHRHLWR